MAKSMKSQALLLYFFVVEQSDIDTRILILYFQIT